MLGPIWLFLSKFQIAVLSQTIGSIGLLFKIQTPVGRPNHDSASVRRCTGAPFFSMATSSLLCLRFVISRLVFIQKFRTYGTVVIGFMKISITTFVFQNPLRKYDPSADQSGIWIDNW